MKKINSIDKKYNKDYDLIIRLYSMNKLYLTNKELNHYLKLRGEKKYHKLKLINNKAVIV